MSGGLLAAGRAPAVWRREMASTAAGLQRLSLGSSWLGAFRSLDPRLRVAPLLGTSLERLTMQGERSESHAEDRSTSKSAAWMDDMQVTAAPSDYRERRAKRSSPASSATGGPHAAAQAAPSRIKSRPSLDQLQTWAASSPNAIKVGARATAVAPVSLAHSTIKLRRLLPGATAAKMHNAFPVPPSAEWPRHWLDVLSRAGATQRDDFSTAASFSSPTAATTIGLAAKAFAIPLGGEQAPWALLTRWSADPQNDATPTAAPRTANNDSAARAITGETAVARTSKLVSPHVAEQEPNPAPPALTKSVWRRPPLEKSDSGAATSRTPTTDNTADDALAIPVTALRGFEPGGLVTPRMLKGSKQRAPMIAEAEPGDEDLSGLAERIKKILDDEARRHGIPV